MKDLTDPVKRAGDNQMRRTAPGAPNAALRVNTASIEGEMLAAEAPEGAVSGFGC